MSTKINDKPPDIVIDERLEDDTDRLEPPHMAITLIDPTISTFEEAKNPSEHPVEEPHDFDTVDSTTIRRTRNKKILIALCLLSFVIFVIVDTFTTGHVKNALRSLLTWIEENPMLGFFVFMLVYMVSVGELTPRHILPLVSESSQAQLLTFPPLSHPVLVIPGSILTLGAGFVFAKAFGLGRGVVLGSLSVFLGASLGAMIAFLFGRYLFRDWVKQLTKKYDIFQALDIAVEQKGLRIMALLRLLPVIPFIALNYIAGVTAISFRDNALALLCILPGTIAYVFLGATAGSLTGSANTGGMSTLTIVVIVVGAVFGIIAVFIMTYYARKELKRLIAIRQEEQGDVEPDYSVAIEMRLDENQSEDAPVLEEPGTS